MSDKCVRELHCDADDAAAAAAAVDGNDDDDEVEEEIKVRMEWK
jgi:hypothetical protein